MLFLVVSSPRPERPSVVASRRLEFWTWVEPKLKSGQALFALPKVGRGVATAFNVKSHEELNALLSEWCEMMPCDFQVVPLMDPEKAKRYLRKTGKA